MFPVVSPWKKRLGMSWGTFFFPVDFQFKADLIGNFLQNAAKGLKTVWRKIRLQVWLKFGISPLMLGVWVLDPHLVALQEPGEIPVRGGLLRWFYPTWKPTFYPTWKPQLPPALPCSPVPGSRAGCGRAGTQRCFPVCPAPGASEKCRGRCVTQAKSFRNK